MDCTITSSTNKRCGFTLVEVMIASGVGGLLVMVLASLTLAGARSISSLTNYSDLNAMGMNALDQMTRDIRQAVNLDAATTNQLVFNRHTNQTQLVFSYDPQTRTLTRTADGKSTVLLTGCDDLRFSLYQRSPVPGTYDQYPPAMVNNAKVVGVNWVCSRSILGRRNNTQHTLSAKVVIRKQ